MGISALTLFRLAGAGLLVLALATQPLDSQENSSMEGNPPAMFSRVDAKAIQERIDKTTTAILDAFNRRDRDAYLSAFAESPIILADGANPIIGSSDVARMYLQSPNGLVYEPMRNAQRKFYDLGDWIIETQLVDFRFRFDTNSPSLSDLRQCLTIWEKHDPGPLKVKLLAWNKLAQLKELDSPISPVAYRATRSQSPFSKLENFSEIDSLEKQFHDALFEKRIEDAITFYSPQATVILGETLPLEGQTSIRKHLEQLAPDMWAVFTEREIVQVEGNDQFLLVINRFRWGFQPKHSDVIYPVFGKGVHIWQRDRDGNWKILFDLPNVSEQRS